MAKIYIDDQAYEVAEGDNILQACLGLGLDLPYFCWHPAMGSIGACRQCALVQYQNEEDTRGRIVMGCMTPVSDGARFSLAGEKASTFRRDIIEALMLNHPHDCPVCAEGGECHLQDMTVMAGHRDREYRGRKNTHRNQYLGPLIHHEMNRCISCYRCTRYYRDYAGGTDLAAMASHDHVYFGRHTEGVLESEFAGNLVEVCPTGVFTDKTLVQEYTRKWDLQSAPSVCTGCAVGCNTLPGERYGKLKRVHNRYNSEVNGYFLCDRGRYGGGFVNSEQRIPAVGRRNDNGRFDVISADEAITDVASMAKRGGMVGVGSPRASVEANYLLRSIVGDENFSSGQSAAETRLHQLTYQLLASTRARVASIKDMESADAVLILGEDVTNTAPRAALALRQSVRNRALELAAGLHLDSWQDAAVRNLAQDQLSPLYIADVAANRLDDVAAASRSLCPDDIARLGFAIAAKLDPARESVALGPDLDELAEKIAADLSTAKTPLVVSGTSSANAAVLSAAAAVADALANKIQTTLFSAILPECNSLGVTMLCEGTNSDLDTLAARADQGNIDTLLVLENDLYRRAPAATVDRLLRGSKQVVVLDTVASSTCDAADLVLPSASFAESEGSLVSIEGRAQRHYPVFLPRDPVRSAWDWLLAIGKAAGTTGFQGWHHFDDISISCSAQSSCLGELSSAAPTADFRSSGQKIPRQPHRYSGRTAMRADVSVHEPKQAVDEDSPLAFTMEGSTAAQPGSLLSYVWSPGWNSNQSVHKYQSEVGGALRGGTAGRRLLDGDTAAAANPAPCPPATQPHDRLLLVPRYRIYGSDELSVLAPGIDELCQRAGIELDPATAAELGVSDGDGVTATGQTGSADLEVSINPTLAPGCVAYSRGVAGTAGLEPGEHVVLAVAQNWQRAPDLISTDRAEGMAP